MRHFYRQTVMRLYNIFIKPRGKDADSRRREFILNTMLSGLLLMATIAVLYSAYNLYIQQLGTHDAVVWQTLTFWIITASLLFVSRAYHPGIAAVIFFAFILSAGVTFTLLWGFGLATAELVLALTIVIAGVLFRSTWALLATGLVAVSLAVVTYLQVNNIQQPSTYWKDQPYVSADTVGYIAIFAVIGLVSWLSNRETDRSLKRARRSEAALQKERDNLEITIAERTRQLEDVQLARLLELQRFAEFGRIGANLVHEITNPLTAAMLQLEAMNKTDRAEVAHIKRNLNQLERYLLAARKQIKRESRLRTFAVGAEVKQSLSLVTNRAHSHDVKLVIDKVSNIKLYGDPVKFSQLVTNLLANAIDASVQKNAKSMTVSLHVEKQGDYVVLSITDHGVGISAATMQHLFEPFYSTKQTVRSGLGIGLAMVKQYVEHDFRGSIEVQSTPKQGTTFTVKLRNQERI